MKTYFVIPAIIAVMTGLSAPSVARAQADAGTTLFTVKVDAPQNGTLEIKPPLPADHKVPAGTVLKIKAVPANKILSASFLTGIVFSPANKIDTVQISDQKNTGGDEARTS